MVGNQLKRRKGDVKMQKKKVIRKPASTYRNPNLARAAKGR
jgi:hypothetical protein